MLKFKILNKKKWPEPTYVWKYQSTPPPPPPLPGADADDYFATDTDTMIDVLYEGYLMRFSFE